LGFELQRTDSKRIGLQFHACSSNMNAAIGQSYRHNVKDRLFDGAGQLSVLGNQQHANIEARDLKLVSIMNATEAVKSLRVGGRSSSADASLIGR
jgi:hypothetical protein